MKKFGFATIAATGLAAAVLGFAAPAQAAPAIPVPTDRVHHEWIHDIQQQVNVPQVDTSVRTRGIN
jgi:phosphoribosylcarboxyaminoimidazole (NCAIR) mutase